MIHLSRPSIGDEEIEAVVEVLRSGMLASGPRVREFEERFAEACDVEHAVAVGSGTAALHLGLMALGVGSGDEVVVPSFTFAATANAVRMVGATPVFADVDPTDFTIHVEDVEPLVTARTRAIMPVHLYGQMAPMRGLMELADSAGLVIIEDAAQAHLAECNGQKAGSMGDVGAFSFYPTKNMTTGEGGMITTSNAEVAERARWLRNQGQSERYVHPIVGLNERMTEIEGAIGLVQLRNLPGWTKRRREIAALYRDELNPALGLPIERPDAKHVYHQYTLTPPDRDELRDRLNEVGISSDIYYPKPTHRQTPYADQGYDLPVTDEMARRVVSIPIRPDLTEDELATIVDTLNRVVE